MRALFLLVPIALVAVALAFTWQGFQEPAPAAVTAAAEPPRYAMTGALWLRLGREGEPEFRAQARTLDYYADESVVMKDVTLDSLGGQGSPWHIEAPNGTSPPRERRIRLSGGVRATGTVSEEKLELDTTRLWVDLLRRELYTDAPVKLQSDFRAVAARGLRSDFEGEHVQLLSDVQVDYVPQE